MENGTQQQDNFILDGLKAAWPIIAGYVVLGLPCGLLCQQAGMNWAMCLIMSTLFYSIVLQQF